MTDLPVTVLTEKYSVQQESPVKKIAKAASMNLDVSKSVVLWSSELEMEGVCLFHGQQSLNQGPAWERVESGGFHFDSKIGKFDERFNEPEESSLLVGAGKEGVKRRNKSFASKGHDHNKSPPPKMRMVPVSPKTVMVPGSPKNTKRSSVKMVPVSPKTKRMSVKMVPVNISISPKRRQRRRRGASLSIAPLFGIGDNDVDLPMQEDDDTHLPLPNHLEETSKDRSFPLVDAFPDGPELVCETSDSQTSSCSYRNILPPLRTYSNSSTDSMHSIFSRASDRAHEDHLQYWPSGRPKRPAFREGTQDLGAPTLPQRQTSLDNCSMLEYLSGNPMLKIQLLFGRGEEDAKL
jgi:hypothetical protein